MTTKEVCELLEVSEDTLRYYERIGVVPKVEKNASGFRDYREHDINWVRQALCYRKAGMSIEALIQYRQLVEMGDVTLNERITLLENQREALLQQRQTLDAAIDRMNYKIDKYKQQAKESSQ